MKYFRPILLLCIIVPAFVQALPAMTDKDIRKNILDGYLSNFKGECACPESKDSKNVRCGENSSYFKNNANGDIKCYPADITDDEVNDYRDKYNVPQL